MSNRAMSDIVYGFPVPDWNGLGKIPSRLRREDKDYYWEKKITESLGKRPEYKLQSCGCEPPYWLIVVKDSHSNGDWDEPSRIDDKKLIVQSRWKEILREGCEFFNLDWEKMKNKVGWYLLSSWG